MTRHDDTHRTEIDALRQRLQQAEQRADAAANEARCFRELAEQIQEVFWMTNAMGDQLVYISPAYERIWGQTCQSLYDDPGSRLAWVHDADRERVLTAFKRDAASGDYDEVFRIGRPDGEVRWIRDRAFPVRDDNGDIYRLAGFALDVTEDIGHNDRIRTLHSTIHAQERLSIFAALGSGIAHDLSQPLTAARNFIAHARRSPADTTASLTRADEHIARTVDVIRHLRRFAREGKPTLRRQALQPIVDDAHAVMDPALRAGGIRYQGPSADTLDGVELAVEGVFIQQILRNLLNNAIEATEGRDDEPAQISIGIAHNGAGTIDIAVRDNGHGVAADIDPFETLFTSKDDGLGLGLTISRTLARAHGGDLFLADRGQPLADQAARDAARQTCFVLRLPRS